MAIRTLLKSTLAALLLVLLTSEISKADQTLALNDSLDCTISDTGDHKLFETKKGKTAELDFAKATKSAKGKLQKATQAIKTAKSGGASKAKITKLTEKKNAAK